MDTIIFCNGKVYSKDIGKEVDVFYLRDNLKTVKVVESFLKSMNLLKNIELDKLDFNKYAGVYKFENNIWYFYEPDFKCWENSTEYKYHPELDPEIQAEYMKNLK
ncbi:MAG: hypothetical protein KA369_03640 [Spirochaetes bacterium]|jgi:hypothetical protein|nr:hypothetical protein [Spirochaetota bacterium]